MMEKLTFATPFGRGNGYTKRDRFSEDFYFKKCFNGVFWAGLIATILFSLVKSDVVVSKFENNNFYFYISFFNEKKSENVNQRTDNINFHKIVLLAEENLNSYKKKYENFLALNTKKKFDIYKKNASKENEINFKKKVKWHYNDGYGSYYDRYDDFPGYKLSL